MKKTLLFLLLPFLCLTMQAQHHAVFKSYPDNEGRKSITFVELSTGGMYALILQPPSATVNKTYDIKIDQFDDTGISNQVFQSSIAVTEAGTTPQVAMLSLNGKGTYCISIQPREETTPLAKEFILIQAMGDEASMIDRTSLPQEVQLTFHSATKLPDAISWVYAEAALLGIDTPDGMVFSFSFEDATISLRNKAGKRNIDFTVYNMPGGKTGTPAVSLTGRNEKLVAISQPDSYSMRASAPGDFPMGTSIPLLINKRRTNDTTSVYSAWYACAETNEWIYLASIERKGESNYPQQPVAVLKNGNINTGSRLISAELSKVSVADDKNKWYPLSLGTFRNLPSFNLRTDFHAKVVSGDDRQAFYFETGGYGNQNRIQELLRVDKTGKPGVNLKEQKAFIANKLAKPYIEPWNYEADIQVKVESAVASNFQPGEGLELSIDGDLSTLYHSRWGSGTEFPVTLIYNFDGQTPFDYIVYYPRMDVGVNGNFKEVGVWQQRSGEADYTLVGDYNFEGSPSPAIITLPQRPGHPKAIKFVVKSGMGDQTGNSYVSCAEMQFLLKSPAQSVPDVFTDITCSALRPGVTPAQIESLEIEEYRRLATQLLHGDYPLDARVRDYFPYPNPAKVIESTRTSPYSLLDNATGIYAIEGEEIFIFIGDTGTENISLRQNNIEKDTDSATYPLKPGLNKITARKSGLLYVMYHTDNPQAKPIRIHFASGQVNGLFDMAQHTNDVWSSLLDNAVCEQIDVLGKRSHLIFPVEDFKRYTPDIVELVHVFDSIVWLESDFMGLEKYGRANKNRMCCSFSISGHFMFATPFRTGYSKSAMPHILNVKNLRTEGIWGPAHEIGHMNQTTGFKWVGMTEVSNNIYSQYVQWKFGNPSRLYVEKLSGKFDGNWNNRYEKGFTEMLANKMSQLRHGDVFCKLIPYWQLELYMSRVMNRPDFYADLHERIRTNPIPDTDGDALVQFMLLAMEVSETDLSDFFERWGLLIPIDENLTDHSSIQNQVYYKKDFTVTQRQIDMLKAHASCYAKPSALMHYIHDGNIDCFISKSPVVKGKMEREGDVVTLTGWENVVVYEVYDNNQLVFISPMSSFTIPEGIAKPIIQAVGADGNKVKM